jgi:hypothetical protein
MTVSSLSPCGRGKVECAASGFKYMHQMLSHLQQFANLDHPDGVLAEQMACDGALH